MKKESAIQILNSRKLISTVGKFTIKVASVSNPIYNEDKQVTTNIVNFAAMTPFQVEKANELFKEANSLAKQGDLVGAEELYQKATNSTITMSVLEGRYLPTKGEIVDVEIGHHINKEGEKILIVEAIVPRKAAVASTIKFNFEEDEAGETAGTTTDETATGEINSEANLNASETSSADEKALV